jgi:hypothetical protein
MTDIVGGELFTSDGSIKPVTVDLQSNQSTAVSDAVVFVPLVESEKRVRFSIVNGDTVGHLEAEPKSIHPPYQGFFSERIAKVKRQTADIFNKLKKVHFTD